MLASITRIVGLLPLVLYNADAFSPSIGARTQLQQIPSGRNLIKLEATAVSTERDVKTLLSKHRRTVDELASVSDDVSEITRLRFAMAFDTLAEAKTALLGALAYRSNGRGKEILDAALDAYETASIGGGWDNEVVRNNAPHASVINKYISSKNIVTTSTGNGDLVYLIRASAIDDKAMMDNVSVEQLSEFFVYVKEVHNLVANQRSETSGKLCEVILANDITGVRKPPDSRFGKALSSSSSQYDKLYPSLAGPTMILNLPLILQAFVALFKPLFPKTVQARLKFLRAPVLASLAELTPVATDGNTKKKLMAELDRLLRD